MPTIQLDGESLTIDHIAQVADSWANPQNVTVAIAPDAIERVKRARQAIADFVERGEIVLGPGPQAEIGGEAATVAGTQRRGGKILEDEVAVGHGVEAVLGDAVETERFGDEGAVERDPGAGAGAGAGAR